MTVRRTIERGIAFASAHPLDPATRKPAGLSARRTDLLLSIVCSLLSVVSASADIATSTRFIVDLDRPAPMKIEHVRGSTSLIEPQFRLYGTPLDVSTATNIILLYRTPAMTAPHGLFGRILDGTNGTVQFRFGPAQEGSNTTYAYSIYVGSETSGVITPSATLALLGAVSSSSTTTTPAVITSLDLATTVILNQGLGPWPTIASMEAYVAAHSGIATQLPWGAISGSISNQLDLLALIDAHPGPIGPQGPAGTNGVNGAQGPAGPQGPAGTNGVDGAQGPAGPQGPAGTNGVDGAQGPAGPQGPAGTNGVDGAQGPAGPQGPAGTNGIDGAQGVQGPAGPQGPAGTNGIDATSSSGIASSNITAQIANGTATLTRAMGRAIYLAPAAPVTITVQSADWATTDWGVFALSIYSTSSVTFATTTMTNTATSWSTTATNNGVWAKGVGRTMWTGR